MVEEDESRQPEGDAWGDDIAPERQAELEQRLQQWASEEDHGKRAGPFDITGLDATERETLRLTGADVFWLAARTLAGTDEAPAVAEQLERLRREPEDYVMARNHVAVRVGLHLPALNLAGAALLGVRLRGADLGETNLSRADLFEADLAGADLSETNLAESNLTRASLARANLREANLAAANLVGANLARASMDRADLSGANLVGANLSGADLSETDLSGADAHEATLSGADLHEATLAKVNLAGADLGRADLRKADLREADLGGANLAGAGLARANLTNATLGGAKLARADLGGANLAGAVLFRADLAAVNLVEADLAGSNLARVTLSEADLTRANLAGANLHEANLAAADLVAANLHAANLAETNLADADLREADLSRADLRAADLSGADLRYAHLTVETALADATLTTMTRLADVVWNSAPLARITWKSLPVLGDETWARKRHKDGDKKKKKTAAMRRDEYEVAVRAYRLLAAALRSQGLNEYADHYAYRAHLMQRAVLRRQHHHLRYAGSSLLGLLTGYGYRPLRAFIAYLAIVGAFAGLYTLLAYVGLTAEHFASWDSPLVLSVASFHGRGFFAGGLALTDWAARVGAVEAAIGLLLEITFIATFTQRFFGGR